MATCDVRIIPGSVTDTARDALLSRVGNHEFGTTTHAIALTGASEVAEDGQLGGGGMFTSSRDTPLAEGRKLIGPVLAGRVGMYTLKTKPAHLQTMRQVESEFTKTKLAEKIDSYSEDYGPFKLSDKSDAPWAPLLNTNTEGAEASVSYKRSETNPEKYALFVHSNATPQVEEAIDAMLKENSAATVGDFEARYGTRLDKLSTLQNQRIAAQVATKLGFADQLRIAESQSGVTSTGAYGAPVRCAQHDAMVSYGDMRMSPNNDIRLGNNALDLNATQGNAVVLLHSPYHGATVLTRPDGSTAPGCVRPKGSKTLNSIAARPRNSTSIQMGADELEDLEHRLHFAGKDDTTIAQIAARIGAVDPRADAFSAAHLERAGLGHLKVEKFKTLGAVVFA